MWGWGPAASGSGGGCPHPPLADEEMARPAGPSCVAPELYSARQRKRLNKLQLGGAKPDLPTAP